MKKLIYSLAFVLIVHCTFNIENCLSQWMQMSNGLVTSNSVNSFASSGNNIFAGSFGVYLSTNYGNNWTYAGLNDYVNSLIVSGNKIFAGTWHSGVYLSTNNGTNWTQTALNNQDVVSLAVSGNNIFAGTGDYISGNGVYLSTNNGTNWTQTALNNKSVRSLAILGSYIFAGTIDFGVYLSTNNGASWSNNNFYYPSVYSLATLGSTIFAGTSDGVYFSQNNGASWAQSNLNNQAVSSLRVSGQNIFAGLIWNGIYFSNNYGASWFIKNQGFNGIPTVFALSVVNNYIFASIWSASNNLYSVWRRDLAEIIGIKRITELVPSSYSLQQNYPNPFNPSTNIRYGLPKNGFVKLVVFDVLGREVETLVNEKLSIGTYEATFNAALLSSGVYFCRLQTDNFSDTKKMILTR